MENIINDIVSKITDLFLTPIIYLLISLSIMYFLWGVAIYILYSDDKDKRVEGRDHMIWGMIGLFIIFSVWGIINFINDSVTILG